MLANLACPLLSFLEYTAEGKLNGFGFSIY